MSQGLQGSKERKRTAVNVWRRQRLYSTTGAPCLLVRSPNGQGLLLKHLDTAKKTSVFWHLIGSNIQEYKNAKEMLKK